MPEGNVLGISMIEAKTCELRIKKPTRRTEWAYLKSVSQALRKPDFDKLSLTRIVLTYALEPVTRNEWINP